MNTSSLLKTEISPAFLQKHARIQLILGDGAFIVFWMMAILFVITFILSVDRRLPLNILDIGLKIEVGSGFLIIALETILFFFVQCVRKQWMWILATVIITFTMPYGLMIFLPIYYFSSYRPFLIQKPN